MKKLLSGILAAGLLFAVTTAYAAAPANIGIVDVRNVLEGSKDLDRLKNTLKKKYDPRRKKVLSMQKALEKDVEDLRKNGPVMSKKQRDKLQNQILSAQKDLQKQQFELQRDYMTDRNKRLAELYGKIKNIVKNVAKKDGLNLVINREAAIFVNSNLDITSQVKKAL